ncbi:MAG: hypothetical protein AAF629_28620 [Chloroflexota bacterium]
MSRNLQPELDQLLADIPLPENMNLADARAFLEEYLISTQAGEQLFVTINEEGLPTKASTVKPSNLKFNLGGVLMEVLQHYAKLSGTKDSKITLLLLAINFLQKMKKLAALNVSLTEAKVLLAIYRLINERDTITIDHLQEVIGNDLSDDQIKNALANLERLNCITVTMAGITLNELISIEIAASQEG